MTLALVKVSGAALSLLLWPFLGGSTQGQTINDVAGFYRLVAIDNVRPNGEVVPQYGPNPKGALSLDPSGRYVLFVRRAQLTNFEAPNIREGSAQENRAVVRGSLAHSGTYTIDGSAKTITLRVEASTFPNLDGTEIKRPFTLVENDLTYSMSVPSVGSGIARLVWRRVKRPSAE